MKGSVGVLGAQGRSVASKDHYLLILILIRGLSQATKTAQPNT